jgi:hypothetical protein
MLQSKYLDSQDPATAGAEAQEETIQEETVQEEDPSRDAMLPPGYVMLLKIARARRLLMKGGEPDADRAAALLIDDCKNGRIGRLSLDRPQDAEQMEEERRAFTAAQEQEKEAAARKKAAAGAGSSRAASAEKDRGKTRGNPGRKGRQDTRGRSADRGGQSTRGRSADRGGQSARGASSGKGGAKSGRKTDRDRGRQGRG